MRTAKTLIYADAQADLSLRWEHRSFCWLCRAQAQLIKAVFEAMGMNRKMSMHRSRDKSRFGLSFDCQRSCCKFVVSGNKIKGGKWWRHEMDDPCYKLINVSKLKLHLITMNFSEDTQNWLDFIMQ